MNTKSKSKKTLKVRDLKPKKDTKGGDRTIKSVNGHIIRF